MSNRKAQFPAPPRPELEELLRRSAEKVKNMTDAEREEMIREQCRPAPVRPGEFSRKDCFAPARPDKFEHDTERQFDPVELSDLRKETPAPENDLPILILVSRHEHVEKLRKVVDPKKVIVRTPDQALMGLRVSAILDVSYARHQQLIDAGNIVGLQHYFQALAQARCRLAVGCTENFFTL